MTLCGAAMKAMRVMAPSDISPAMGFDETLKAKIAQVEKGGRREVPREEQGGRQALRPRAHRAARRRGLLRRRRQARQQRSTPSCPRTASSPGWASIDGRTVAHHGQRLDGEGRLAGASARSRRSSASRRRRRKLRCPLFYLVDSAGARITDQVEMFPGPARRGAHLLQRGPPVGRGAADLPALRAVARPAARTSPRSATSSSWSTATPRCTSASRAWPRW